MSEVEFLRLQVYTVYAQIQELKMLAVLVCYTLNAEQQGVCCSFEDFNSNCCMFFKMLTIEKELSIADIRGDSYVNIVYSGYGVCASILVTLQQCRKYLSQNCWFLNTLNL